MWIESTVLSFIQCIHPSIYPSTMIKDRPFVFLLINPLVFLFYSVQNSCRLSITKSTSKENSIQLFIYYYHNKRVNKWTLDIFYILFALQNRKVTFCVQLRTYGRLWLEREAICCDLWQQNKQQIEHTNDRPSMQSSHCWFEVCAFGARCITILSYL